MLLLEDRRAWRPHARATASRRNAMPAAQALGQRGEVQARPAEHLVGQMFDLAQQMSRGAACLRRVIEIFGLAESLSTAASLQAGGACLVQCPIRHGHAKVLAGYSDNAFPGQL